MQPEKQTTNSEWNQRFVLTTIERCKADKGQAARLRRADNPATEYQSWDYLARLGVDLEKPWQRLPFMTVACAIAKARPERNGKLKLGQAIARCYDKGNSSDQAAAKLRRLLACSELEEVSRILRPLLMLISSRVNQPLDFERLLNQLRRFGFDDERIKTQWAQEFYGQQEQPLKQEANAS